MTDRKYATVPTGSGDEVVQTGPAHCVNGHRFGPNRATCGWLPCGCVETGGRHNYWKCRECGAIEYDPPHDATGPATVGSLYDPPASSP